MTLTFTQGHSCTKNPNVPCSFYHIFRSWVDWNSVCCCNLFSDAQNLFCQVIFKEKNSADAISIGCLLKENDRRSHVWQIMIVCAFAFLVLCLCLLTYASVCACMRAYVCLYISRFLNTCSLVLSFSIAFAKDVTGTFFTAIITNIRHHIWGVLLRYSMLDSNAHSGEDWFFHVFFSYVKARKQYPTPFYRTV